MLYICLILIKYGLDNLMILSCKTDIPIDKNNVIDQFAK
jgi:hypothetical protein